MKEYFTNTALTEDTLPEAEAAQTGPETKKTYEVLGYEHAGMHVGSIQGFRSAFKKFYDHFKRNEYLKQVKSGQRERLRLAEIARLTVENQNLESRVLEAEQHTRQGLRQRIEQLHEDISRIKQNPELAGGKHDPVSYYGSMVLVAVLGLFLYFFYSSVIYSVLFREVTFTKNAVLTAVFYSRAWAEAWQKDFFTFLIIMLAPSMFIVIGFLVHKAQVARRYWAIAGLLCFTLLLDSLMAFHIARSIEEGKALNSFKELPHYGLGEAVVDVNFWIIIGLGFAAYIIWGLLLHQFMLAWQERNRLNSEINRLLAKINGLKEEEEALIGQIAAWREQARLNRAGMAELEANAHTAIISLTAFLRAASSFTHGWNRYLNAAGKPELAGEVNELMEELVKEIKGGE